jgi:hypothetical protein
MPFAVRTVVAGLCALLAACSTAPVTLDGNYRPAKRTASRANVPAVVPTCDFHLANLEDRRPSTETLGVLAGGVVVRSEDFPAWLRSGFATVPGYAPGPERGIGLRVELLKAYLQSISTAKTAAIVVRVGYPGGEAGERKVIYRGENTSTNWSSSEAETRAALDAALAEVLGKVRADLSAACPPAGASVASG